MALQYQLARYAYIFERALVADGYALDNDSGKIQKRNGRARERCLLNTLWRLYSRSRTKVSGGKGGQGSGSNGVHKVMQWSTKRK
jgi:hypothetical protein